MKSVKGRKPKIILIIALCVLIVGGIIFAVLMIYLNSYQEKVKNTHITNVEISAIPDGSYIGEYDVGLVYARVEVEVKEGVITDITILEHRNGRGESAESVVDAVIAEQTTNVDAVTGATSSSTVLKKAIELALLGE